MHALNYCFYSVYSAMCLHGYFVYTVTSLHVFAAFRTAAHDVTPRNCTDSKYNPHDDENDMDDWHDVCIFPIYNYCRSYIL